MQIACYAHALGGLRRWASSLGRGRPFVPSGNSPDTTGKPTVQAGRLLRQPALTDPTGWRSPSGLANRLRMNRSPCIHSRSETQHPAARPEQRRTSHSPARVARMHGPAFI